MVAFKVCFFQKLELHYINIPREWQSNVTVLQDIIDVRDGGRACESLGIDDVQFIIDEI